MTYVYRRVWFHKRSRYDHLYRRVQKVTPAAATVTTGSASKAYDGAPLTSAEAGITGLVGGDTAAVTATGAITNAGTATNTYAIDWGDTKASNYAVTENLGEIPHSP